MYKSFRLTTSLNKPVETFYKKGQFVDKLSETKKFFILKPQFGTALQQSSFSSLNQQKIQKIPSLLGAKNFSKKSISTSLGKL